jgi:hypothetical protein
MSQTGRSLSILTAIPLNQVTAGAGLATPTKKENKSLLISCSLMEKDHPLVDPQFIGMLGHSYGGNTVLFHGALDERIRFACASIAACSYQYKMEHGIGIEMAEVIPGFTTHYDIQDLVLCFAPRPLLVISADEDSLSKDATWIVHNAREASTAIGTTPQIEHQHYAGGHALTKERFDNILTWLIGVAG